MPHMSLSSSFGLLVRPRCASVVKRVLSLMLIVGMCGMSQASLVLINDGVARAVVVTGDESSATAQLAAEELVWHLQKATGVELSRYTESTVPSGAVRTRIYIGDCQAARDAGVELSGFSPDTAVLCVVDGNLYLLGVDSEGDPLSIRNHAGTLFAVYELLESVVGVRWIWPGELGAHVPVMVEVSVPSDLDEVVVPAIGHRHVWGAGSHARYRPEGWNDEYRRELNLFLRRHRLGWSTLIEDPAHSFSTWWERYGEEHPEWFALSKEGERDGKYGMELTNPELQRFVVENYREHSPEGIRRPAWVEHNGENWFRLGDVDLSWQPSLSEESLAWDGPLVENCIHADGLYESFGRHHVADRYARFYQTIYDLASEQDPDVKVTGYLYWSYLMAPTTDIKISPQVYGHFAPWSYIDTGTVFFPLPDHGLDWIKRQWLGWRGTGMSMIYRPNHWHGNYVMPHLERQGVEFVQWAYEHDMVGFKFDRLMDQWAVRGPTLYLYFRVFADPEGDIDAYIQEYYEPFGPAAAQIQAYVEYWEDYARMRHTPVELPPGTMTGKNYNTGAGIEPLVPNPLINPSATALAFPPDVFLPAMEILDQAARAAEADPTGEAQARVAFLRVGLDHALLVSEFWATMEVVNAGRARLPEDPQRRAEAVEAFARMEDFRYRHGDSAAVNFGEAAVYYEGRIKDVQELREAYDRRRTEAGEDTSS